MRKLKLSKEELKRIDEISANPPEPTDYMKRYIEAYKKKCADSSEAEQGTLNLKVVGSTPTRHTK